MDMGNSKESPDTMTEEHTNDHPEVHEFSVAEDAVGERIDSAIAAEIDDLSRTAVRKLLDDGQVTVNGETVKPKYKLQPGDRVRVIVPPPTAEEAAQPEDIPIDIIYEDEDIIVINKGPDMVVHPAPGAWTGTLVNALLHHCKDLSGIGGVKRPGIVHRIDKDTTGLLAVAKNDAAHRSLSEQIVSRDMKRAYRAIVARTILEDSGVVDVPIGRSRRDRTLMAVMPEGREARTHWRVLKRTHGLTYIELGLDTGRSHQIRVHMRHIGHPVIGDPNYGPPPKEVLSMIPSKAQTLQGLVRHLRRQMLHAFGLRLIHPRTGDVRIFQAPLPKDFQTVVDHLVDAD